jgi:hypothetical protein
MDWKAFGVIGLFTLALGVLLYVPARIWVKRKLRTEPDSHPKLRLTKLGWILISVSILVLIGGLLMNDLAPESMFGQFMKTSKGRFLYLVIVAVIFWFVEAALKARGIKLIKEDNKSG